MLNQIISLNNTSADISENFIREQMPEILDLLLIDIALWQKGQFFVHISKRGLNALYYKALSHF